MGGYYASIAKSLERIADALEKMTAPSVDGRDKHQAPEEDTGAATIESVIVT